MFKNKHLNMRKKNKKLGALFVGLALLLSLSVGGTLAFLVTESQEVTNTFTYGNVPSKIEETIEGGVKEDVRIANVGDVPAYIRAAVTVNWVKLAGDGVSYNMYGVPPVEGTDYSINWTPVPTEGSSRWIKGIDGFYYYTRPVADGTSTEDFLFDEGKVLESANIPDGYELSIEIMAQTIQADGEDSNGNKPVELAWGYKSDGTGTGSVKRVNSDGTLDIQTAASSGTGQ